MTIYKLKNSEIEEKEIKERIKEISEIIQGLSAIHHTLLKPLNKEHKEDLGWYAHNLKKDLIKTKEKLKGVLEK